MYLTIILASLPAAFLYNLYGALLRAIGRANATLMVLAAAVTVNVALDYCFVARFQLGIASTAWATAASQAISAVLCILYLRRKAPELIFARADCRMDGELLKQTALFYTLCFTGNTFAGYFNGIGKVCVPFLGATSHIALRVVLSWLLVGKMGLPAVVLATGLGWVLVNALWTFVKWRMEKKQKAAERDIM